MYGANSTGQVYCFAAAVARRSTQNGRSGRDDIDWYRGAVWVQYSIEDGFLRFRGARWLPQRPPSGSWSMMAVHIARCSLRETSSRSGREWAMIRSRALWGVVQRPSVRGARCVYGR